MPVTPFRLTQDMLKKSTNPVIQRLVANHFYLDAKDGGVTVGRDVQRASLQISVNGTVIDSTLDGLTAVLEENNQVIKQRVFAIAPDLKERYEVAENAYAQPCRSTIEKAVSALVNQPCQSTVLSRMQMDSKHKTNSIVSEVREMTIPGIAQPVSCEGTKMIWSLVDVDQSAYKRIKDAEIAELEKKKNPSTPRTAGAIDRQIEQIRNQSIPEQVYQLTEIQVSNRLLQEALMNNDWVNIRKLTELSLLCDKYLAECRTTIERMLKQDKFSDIVLPYMNTAEYRDAGVVIHTGFNFAQFIKEYDHTDSDELNGLVEKYNEMTTLKQILDQDDQPASSRVADFSRQFKEKQPVLEDTNDVTIVKLVKAIAIAISSVFFIVPGYYLYQKLWKHEKGAELSEKVERLVSTPAP